MITNEYLDEAIDRVVAGPQKRSRLMNDKEKLVTAYHEGGHALVAAALPGTDPVQKVTILPRGRALGYTMVLPEQDKYANTRAELLDQLAYMMGGRAAEELVFHDPTTGASNDIEKATTLARAMVTQYGMTERLGAIKLGSGDAEPFLGRDIGHGRDYSEEVAAIVDEEVSKLISNAHQEAFDILNENRDVLDDLVRALFEKETLDRDEVAAVFQPLRLWPKRPAWTGSDERVPSSVPPVTPPPPSVNGQAERSRWQRSTQPRPRGPRRRTPQPPGHPPVPSQLPATGDSEPAAPKRPGLSVTELDEAADVSRDGAGSMTGIDPIHFPERVGEFDHDRVVAAVREILIGIGEDPDRDGLRETPERVARAYAEMFGGLRQDPEKVLATSSTSATTSWCWSRTSRSGALRAPPRALHRGRARRLHPQPGGEDHRAQQARPPG